MKALTICQPYAELIARGDKRVENREWPTRYRGLLYIHAGKSREWMNDGDDGMEYDYGLRVADMSFGAVVAVARLVDCLEYDFIMRGMHREKYPWLKDHEHTNGPWCWILADVSRVKPVPWRGALGLWDCPAVTESI